jgi:hypothetical protein
MGAGSGDQCASSSTHRLDQAEQAKCALMEIADPIRASARKGTLMSSTQRLKMSCNL